MYKVVFNQSELNRAIVSGKRGKEPSGTQCGTGRRSRKKLRASGGHDWKGWDQAKEKSREKATK